MSPSELGSLSLLESLDDAEREAVAPALEVRELPAGQRLFAEGDAADALWWVARGRVAVRSRRVQPAGEFGAGAALGALSLVVGGRRESSAETLSRTRVLILRSDAFQRLVADAPRAACRLLEAIVRDNAALVRPLLDRLGAASIDPGARRD